MESLAARLRDLEHLVDVDYNLNEDFTVSEALDQLNNAINNFINNHQGLLRLFNSLNDSSLKTYSSDHGNLTEEQLAYERSYIELNMDKIEGFANQLKHYELIDLDVSILNKNEKILAQNHEVVNLRLKYNELVIRSINLLQNYLKLNDNMNQFYREVKKKIQK